MSYHSTLQWLPKYGYKTQALWADNPTGTLVFFVHGFRGKSVATWTKFQALLPMAGKGREADFIFFGYDGFRAHIDLSAHLLQKFLLLLLGSPAAVPLKPVHRSKTFQYHTVVFVAHSMGAIVLRRALLWLLAKPKKPSLTRTIRLVFFAPAHAGVDQLELARESINILAWVPKLYLILRAISPALRDLGRRKTFDILKKETKAALARNEPRGCLVAYSTTFGDKENVVTDQSFCADPKAGEAMFNVIQGLGHSAVAKPKNASDMAINILLQAL